jgi:hypothetical protein
MTPQERADMITALIPHLPDPERQAAVEGALIAPSLSLDRQVVR